MRTYERARNLSVSLPILRSTNEKKSEVSGCGSQGLGALRARALARRPARHPKNPRPSMRNNPIQTPKTEKGDRTMRDNPIWPPRDPRPCPRQNCDIDVTDHRHYGHCMHCGHHIGSRTSKSWSALVKRPCPRCGRPW